MKHIFSTYFSAIRLLFFKWKAWLVVFIANLIFAMLVAYPFGKLLDKLAGHSDAPLEGMSRFDFDFIADVYNNYGTELYVVIGQAVVFAGIYLILNIFMAGGLIESYVHVFERFTFSQFWANCSKHFVRMFRLALYFVITQIFVIAFFVTVYTKLGLSPFQLESDDVLIFRTQIMLAAFVIIMAWIDMVNEYAKVKVVIERDRKVILPIVIEVKYFCLRHFFPIATLFILCVLSFLGVLGLYAMINNVIVMESMGTIVLAFLIGQMYLILRIGTRLLFTSAAVDYLRTKEWGR